MNCHPTTVNAMHIFSDIITTKKRENARNLFTADVWEMRTISIVGKNARIRVPNKTSSKITSVVYSSRMENGY